jgi:hypothetical protein
MWKAAASCCLTVIEDIAEPHFEWKAAASCCLTVIEDIAEPHFEGSRMAVWL